MIENIIKIVLTIPLLSAVVFSILLILRLWNTQIDAPKTAKMWLGDQLAFSSWIATIDEDSIYQDGRIIGRVEVPPIIKKGKITFPRVRYISSFDDKKDIEYRRFTCRNIKINGSTQVQGMEIAGWFQDLECEIIQN